MTSRKAKRVAVISLGCAKNLVDTEIMCGALATHGFVLTNDQAEADVLLVNTCSFIADARAESENEITHAVAWKRQAPAGRRLVVTGCLPQRSLASLRKTHPEVDLFAGLDDVPRIADLVAGLYAPRPVAGGGAAAAATEFALPQYLYDGTAPRLLLTPQNSAYVKIAEGCDHHCRFCAIPSIRGRQRSRTIASVVAECQGLLAQGIREINFIAQDTTRYGADLKDGTTLAQLLTACDQLAAPAPYWLRVLYTHPRYFSDELVQVFATAKHLVPYIDIPLQHIAEPMLTAMGRGLGGAATRARLAGIRAVIPEVTIRTTFLVGYPGETDSAFAELLDYITEFRFDRLGVFAFSPETGTPAAAITEGLVPRELAEERRDRLMRTQHTIALENNRRFVNREIPVLVEKALGKGKFVARSAGDAPDVDNVVHLRGPHDLLERGFATATITRADAYELFGTARGK